MAKKRIEPDVQRNPWKSRIERMRKRLEKNSKDWDTNERLIFGSDEKGNNEIAYGWGLYQGLLTAIYINNPTPIVESFSQEGREAAAKATQILRYDAHQMGLKELGNLCIEDVFISGYGVITEVCETSTSTVRYPVTGADGSVKEEEEPRVDEQNYIAERIDPKDFLVDPQCKLLDLSDARYCAAALYMTIEDLKADKRFKLPEKIEEYAESNSEIRSKGPRSTEGSDSPRSTSSEKDESYKTVCVWEIWDKVGDSVIYMLDQSNHILYESEKWPVRFNLGGKKLFPFSVLAMHPRRKGWFPKPEISLIAPQLEEMNQIEAMMREDSTTKRRVWVTLGEVFKPDQIAKLNDIGPGKRNRVIAADWSKLEDIMGGKPEMLAHIDVRNLLGQLEEISMAKDLPVRHQMLEQNISHILGYGPSQRGGVPSTRSAREAMLMAQKQTEKLNKRIESIDSWNSLVYAKHIMLLQQTLDVSRYAKVVDEVGGVADYFAYTGEDLKGQFRFDVIPGSAGPKTTQMKQQSIMQMAQMLFPILQAEGQSAMPLVELVAKTFDWPDVDRVFSGLKGKLKGLAGALFQFQAGQAKPEAVIEIAAAVVNAGLSKAEMQMVAKLIQGQAPAQQATPAQGIQGESTSSRAMPEGM